MDELKLIKKYYNEKMMHLCRELFPSLLEKEGLLFSLLEKNFAYSKFLANDILKQELESEFKNYIYSLVDVENKKIEVIKTPKELLDEAGYILYECKSESDIQSFKKYYAENEELCTFRGGRLNRCHVFFAIKKNINDIKRENFKNPTRQDEYGTSVISIQFSKGSTNTLSIKNRYNHHVNNPDATFSNNLENIIPGLTKSFEREYRLNINQNSNLKFELDGYVKANDGKYYKYNYEINNIYYCPNNIIIDNFEVKHYEKEKYIVLDYFILDLVNKKIKLYDEENKDSFPNELENIKKIEINNLTDSKLITIINEQDKIATIEIDKYNKIISYENEFLKEIGDFFLYYNKVLKKINLSSVVTIKDYFLPSNKELTKLDLPNVEEIGENFLSSNEILKELNLPKLINVRNFFLYINEGLTKLDLPNVDEVGRYFLTNNETLEEINLPNVTVIDKGFLSYNKKIRKINLQSIIVIGSNFLSRNEILEEINIPNVSIIRSSFLEKNNTLKKIYLPNINMVGSEFLSHNEVLEEINVANVREIGDSFLEKNNALEKITLLKIKEIGNRFLYSNEVLKEINISNPDVLEDDFFHFYYNKINIIRKEAYDKTKDNKYR